MEFIQTILIDAAHWLRLNIVEVSQAWVATALVIFGNDINKYLKNALKRYHFAIKNVGFVLFCAFGYSFLMFAASPIITQALALVPHLYLASVIVLMFTSLGVIAEQKKYI